MALTNHQHDERILDALIGPSVPAEDHLLACVACRNERDRLATSFASFAHAVRSTADRPGHFWTRQSAQVHERIATAPDRRMTFASRMVSAMAILALLAFLLLQGAPSPQPQPIQAAYSDHDLLMAVERALQRDTPAALEPVSLLVEDMVRPSSARSQKFSKEPTHHDN